MGSLALKAQVISADN